MKQKLCLFFVLSLALLLSACQETPKQVLEKSATALHNKDSRAFLALFDMKAYAAHEFTNLKQKSEILSSLDAMGKAFGLENNFDEIVDSIVSLEDRYMTSFRRTVDSGQLVTQCKQDKSSDCPWIPEALIRAEIKVINPEAQIAKISLPDGKQAWIALRKNQNQQWLIVGKSEQQERAIHFALDSQPIPQKQ